MSEFSPLNENYSGSSSEQYPFNITIDVAGISFDGPGMENRGEAESIKQIVESKPGVDKCEVFKQ